MAERPEDLNLPNAVITRIIKEALPDGVNISKEARSAISRAASVFVLYATSWFAKARTLWEQTQRNKIRAELALKAHRAALELVTHANNFAMKGKRKTLNAGDVLSAMEEMEFQRFIAPLKESLEVYRREQKGKKEARKDKDKKADSEEQDKSREDDNDDDDERMEDEEQNDEEEVDN